MWLSDKLLKERYKSNPMSLQPQDKRHSNIFAPVFCSIQCSWCIIWEDGMDAQCSALSELKHFSHNIPNGTMRPKAHVNFAQHFAGKSAPQLHIFIWGRLIALDMSNMPLDLFEHANKPHQLVGLSGSEKKLWKYVFQDTSKMYSNYVSGFLANLLLS